MDDVWINIDVWLMISSEVQSIRTKNDVVGTELPCCYFKIVIANNAKCNRVYSFIKSKLTYLTKWQLRWVQMPSLLAWKTAKGPYTWQHRTATRNFAPPRLNRRECSEAEWENHTRTDSRATCLTRSGAGDDCKKSSRTQGHCRESWRLKWWSTKTALELWIPTTRQAECLL